MSAQEAAEGEAGDPGKALVVSQHHALLRQTPHHPPSRGPTWKVPVLFPQAEDGKQVTETEAQVGSLIVAQTLGAEASGRSRQSQVQAFWLECFSWAKACGQPVIRISVKHSNSHLDGSSIWMLL